MKPIQCLIFIVIFGCFSCDKKNTEKKEVFKVWGNCERCKKTIEKASDLEGVTYHNWNIESKLMTVTFDSLKTSLDAIEQSIARVGYDNDKYYGDDYSYYKLENCCQYERKLFEVK